MQQGPGSKRVCRSLCVALLNYTLNNITIRRISNACVIEAVLLSNSQHIGD